MHICNTRTIADGGDDGWCARWERLQRRRYQWTENNSSGTGQAAESLWRERSWRWWKVQNKRVDDKVLVGNASNGHARDAISTRDALDGHDLGRACKQQNQKHKQHGVALYRQAMALHLDASSLTIYANLEESVFIRVADSVKDREWA